MNKRTLSIRSFFVALLAGSIAFLAGCESSNDTSTSLTVSPSSVTLDEYPEAVTFAVSGSTPSSATGTVNQVMNATLGPLSMPLVWAVSNPNLGTIVQSSGNQAVYQRTRSTGINIITVVDQYGQEGIARVTQESEETAADTGSLALQASRPTIPNGESTSVISVASGGTGSYTWAIEDPPSGTSSGGSLSTTSGATTTYQSSNPGSIVIRATDTGNGRTGQISITQE